MSSVLRSLLRPAFPEARSVIDAEFLSAVEGADLLDGAAVRDLELRGWKVVETRRPMDALSFDAGSAVHVLAFEVVHVIRVRVVPGNDAAVVSTEYPA